MRHDKLEKELRLLLLLTENHRYDVAQVCERTGISRRMLYYYLESFRDWGFIVEKQGHTYSIDRQSPFFLHLFETINFTEEEALTLMSILNKVDDSNAIVSRIRHKLDRFYDLRILSSPDVREQQAHNVGVLYAAIKGKRMVALRGYSSPHSGTVADRVVEPFLLMNNNNDLRAYEPASACNKTFKVARMTDVALLDVVWSHEDRHREVFTDVFMFSGEERRHVSLVADQLAHHLLTEEYPQTARFVRPEGDRWAVGLDVASYLGIGRFVLGLYDHVGVRGDAAFIDWLNRQAQAIARGFPAPASGDAPATPEPPAPGGAPSPEP